MLYNFKNGDRVLFAHEEDLMEGVVQDARDGEVTIQFNGISYPSNLDESQLQHIEADY